MERLRVKSMYGRIVLLIDGDDCPLETGIRFRRDHWGKINAALTVTKLNEELGRGHGHRWYEIHLPKIAERAMPCDDGYRMKKYALRMRLLAREARA